MPRKPKRAAPDVPTRPEGNADWSWGPDSGPGAGSGGTAEGGRSTGAEASPGGTVRAKATGSAGAKAKGGGAATARATGSPSAKGSASPAAGAGGKVKAGAKATAATRQGATKQGTTPKGMPGTRGDLSRVEVEAIRELALEIARKGAGPDTVLICNPISEPSALPAKELRYDRCRWCETDIYYDRLMPSPPDLMRVCLKCGILLLEAEKKGKN